MNYYEYSLRAAVHPDSLVRETQRLYQAMVNQMHKLRLVALVVLVPSLAVFQANALAKQTPASVTTRQLVGPAKGPASVPGTLAPSQLLSPTASRDVFVMMEGRALAAKTDDQAEVTRLVDEAFRRTIFNSAGRPLRDRVVATELAFRRGTQRGISVDTVAHNTNRLLTLMAAPAFMHTSDPQVRLFRSFLRTHIPDLGHARAITTSESGPMSPFEAAFLVMSLATQKVLNPQYRVPPATWVDDMNDRLEGLTPPARGAPAGTPVSVRPR